MRWRGWGSCPCSVRGLGRVHGGSRPLFRAVGPARGRVDPWTLSLTARLARVLYGAQILSIRSVHRKDIRHIAQSDRCACSYLIPLFPFPGAGGTEWHQLGALEQQGAASLSSEIGALAGLSALRSLWGRDPSLSPPAPGAPRLSLAWGCIAPASASLSRVSSLCVCLCLDFPLLIRTPVLLGSGPARSRVTPS